MATLDAIASALVTRATARGQAVVRCDASIPVDDLRERVRALARAEDVRVRTGLVDDVLVVARADAQLWSDDTATMRAKLAAPPEVGQVA